MRAYIYFLVSSLCVNDQAYNCLIHFYKNEDNLKNEDYLKNEDDFKNEVYLKNENDLLNEDDITTSNWKQSDLEDCSRPKFTQL